jgi:hypothetical protein
MYTRQRDETERVRDISGIVETLASLGKIFRKTARYKVTSFCQFKVDEYSMAITDGIKSSLHMGFAVVSGLHAAGTPVCTTLQKLPPGEPPADGGGQTGCCPKQPLAARAVSQFFQSADLME